MRMVFGRQADHELLGLSFLSLLDSQLATIVTAARAYGVVNVVCATVRADSQRRHHGFVMGTTFRLSGVRLSSFRMCHNYLTFYFITYFIFGPLDSASIIFGFFRCAT